MRLAGAGPHDVSHIDYRGVPLAGRAGGGVPARGGDVKLAGVSPYLLAILRAAGAHDAFEIYPDAGDAREALSQGQNAWLH